MTELSGYVFEPLWQDGEFLLSRGVQGDTKPPLLVMSPVLAQPAPGSLKRLEHAYGLRDELDPAWAIRPLELVRNQGRPTLLLEDPGGELLARLVGQPWEVSRFLHVALGLAGALGRLHARGLIHKDIKPAHILVNTATGEVRLTGFGIASRLPRERPVPEPPEMIAGTLAYMAPEQTGRMNRSIDSRSDLYAFGVTLYGLLTGTLPFTATEPLEWIHCHIARPPRPPTERVPGIPAPLAAIVLKLLAKTADERYQTAAGVEADLRICLVEWESRRQIDTFTLGAHDTPDRLLIPETLYGRAREIETLLASFERVVTSGTPELVLVSGYAGIGKSSVVNELHKVLVPPRGLFASGKFDQYKRDIPYATLAQALQSLIRPLLSKSDAELNSWREALREAVGPNGRLMVDLVPELKLIIGEQPPILELPPQDAQRRFQLVLRRFIGVFARSDHPLALFLDDLQWLDAATLDLLEDLLTQGDVQHLMLIGAYRDNEVDPTHPLIRKLRAMRQAGAILQDIVLAPLAREDLGQLLVDALHCEPERAAPLAHLVHEKTAGNPFFAIQFISTLAEEGLLTFDHSHAQWLWDVDHIHAKGYTENVVDLMVGKLNRLPVETQNALQQLACLGNSAEFAMLRMVYEDSTEDMHGDLWEAVRTGLVVRSDGAYRFLHDRVQEAAYALVPVELRAAAHLRIGRLLLAHTLPEQREEAIFEIVNQLNRGATLITSRDEREDLAELNLIAGKRAKASTAYTSALTYLVAGAALLAEDAWERRHELTFALELNRAECEFLTGAVAAAEERLTALSTRAATTIEHAAVSCLRMDVHVTLRQSGRAIAVGLDYLRRVGIDWSPHPTDEDVRCEYERIWAQLGGRTVEELIELPLMSDPVALATLDVLTKLGTPASITNMNLGFLNVCQAVNLSLERGNSDGSCWAYATLSSVAGPHFGNYQAGFRFGQLAYDLIEHRGLRRFQALTYMGLGNAILPLTRHVRAGREMTRRAFEAANKVGDLTCAAHCCHQLTTHLLADGDPLAETQREAENGLAFAQQMRFGFAIDVSSTQLGLIRTLRGLTRKFGSLDDAQFDERRIERRFADNPDWALGEWWYRIRKLQARYLAGDYAAAVEAASQVQRPQQPLREAAKLNFYYIQEAGELHFYGALSHAAWCDSAAADQRQQHVEALAAYHRRLAVWAENRPEHFENRAALVGAEIARLEGRALDALRLYERAIDSARANGFVHDEALAHELAGRFSLQRGLETAGAAHLRHARACYARWGAEGKVRHLEQLYPQLGKEELVPGPTSTIGAPVAQLDLSTVLKVSQAVSGEIVLEKLIDTLMRTAIEHAGAARGLLILPHGEELRIEAEATVRGETVTVWLREAHVAALPESVLHYVVRTQESVILDDASAQNPFSADAYLRQTHARSVLCLPLVKQASLIGVLYLENHLTSHVFTPARIAVLQLLASQAAISLENARLYTDLQHENHERQRAEENVRRSEAYLTEAQHLSRTGSLGCKVSSGEMAWSAETFRIFAYDRATQPTVEAILQRVHPEDKAMVQEQINRATSEGKDCDLEYRLLLPDDSVKHVHVVAHAVKDEAGGFELVGAVMDITATKRAQQTLEQAFQEVQDLRDQHQLVIDTIPGLVWSALPEGSADFLNQRWLNYTGLSLRDALGWGWGAVIHPDDRPRLMEVWRERLATGKPGETEARMRRVDGEYRWFLFRWVPLYDERGNLVKWYGTNSDIEDRKRADALLAGERRLLEMIATGNSLSIILDALCRFVEELSEGSLSSILLLDPDGTRLWHGAAPSLPKSYTDAIDGSFIGPVAGSCGTAAYRKEPIIVSDIAQDPLWAEYRDLALAHGLRACWSTPILASDDQVLGTFALYSREPSSPTLQQQNIIAQITALASVAIERQRAEEERQAHLGFLESMERVNRAIQGTNDLEQMMSAVLDVVLAIFQCDRAWLVYPCDPEAASWTVPMEHVRPEFPGIFGSGLELSVDPEVAKVFHTARASSGPVRFGPGVEHPLPAEVAQQFSVQSALAMAIYPKADKPYLVGLHQCSYPRVWTAQEERLFQEIGRRLEDALTGLLMLRNLRESERKLEEAQRLTHVGYWELDPGTNLITWSDETYRICGLPPQGRSINLAQLPELLHPEDQQRIVQAVAEALRSGPRYDVEYRVVRPSGEVRIVHAQGDVLRDESGRPRRMFGTAQDITERKRAEEALRKSERQFRALFDQAAVGIAFVNSAGRALESNQKLQQVFGYSGEEFRSMSFAQYTHPDDLNLDWTLFAELVSGKRDHYQLEKRYYRKDGSLTWGNLTVSLVRDDKGEPLFGISIIEDISERKRTEEALREAQAGLAHVTRVATLGEMTTSIAHEINQPLGAVVNSASACLRWLDAQKLEEARRSVSRVIAEGHRASEIIGRIRALAKKAPPLKDWLDINETIREVIALAHSEVQRNGVAIETQLSDEAPVILADRIQLQQVILNLLMNAIEAMSGSGEGPRELLIRSGTDGSQGVLVSVQDSGPGLDPQNLNRLFEAFYTTKPHGLGMGLAISRSIVEAHGGRLWATANAPHGAVFQFTLPLGSERMA